MSRRVINVGGSFLGLLNPQTIFGEKTYDWFDFTDNDTLELSGVRIDAINSKAIGSTRAFVSSGGARPQVVANQINGLQVGRFDGVSEFMDIPNSTSLYNFLHNQEGGVVIMVFKGTKLPDRILGNRGGFAAPDNASGVLIGRTGGNEYASIVANNQSSLANAAVSDNRGGIGDSTKFISLINILKNDNPTAAERNEIILNGTESIKNNIYTNALSDTNAGFNMTLGRRVRLNDQYFGGDVPEIIIVKGQPTEEELTKTSIYINKKYGNLPT
jgi:hypothetical protein